MTLKRKEPCKEKEEKSLDVKEKEIERPAKRVKKESKREYVTWSTQRVLDWMGGNGAVERSWFSILYHRDNVLYYAVDPSKQEEYKGHWHEFVNDIDNGQHGADSVVRVSTHDANTGQPHEYFERWDDISRECFNDIKAKYDAVDEKLKEARKFVNNANAEIKKQEKEQQDAIPNFYTRITPVSIL